jgi:SAM-dependent methyltransferase
MNEKEVVELYEPRFKSSRHANFYGHSGYSNFGYWDENIHFAHDACDCLIDRLLSHLSSAPSSILDVACGEGGTTSRLRQRYESATIKAVNISEHQLSRAIGRCPDVEFMKMDATKLEFPDSTFDLVICVEAAFHFQTREAFLREAFRVLRPGGSLLLTDGILSSFPGFWARLLVPDFKTIPIENHISLAQFERQLDNIGFQEIDIQNALERTFLSCERKFVRYAWAEYLQLNRWPALLLESPPPCNAIWWYVIRRYLEAYLLVHAVRPARDQI